MIGYGTEKKIEITKSLNYEFNEDLHEREDQMKTQTHISCCEM